MIKSKVPLKKNIICEQIRLRELGQGHDLLGEVQPVRAFPVTCRARSTPRR